MILTRAAALRLGLEPVPVLEIQTNCNFTDLLQAAIAREDQRVLEHDDEDDLDGWELEDEDHAALLDSPLSSPPTSRSPTPQPATISTAVTDELPEASRHSRTRRGRGKKRKREDKSEKVKTREKEFAKKRKAAARAEEREAEAKDARNYKPAKHALNKIAALEPLKTNFDVSHLHAAQGGFIGKRLAIEGFASAVSTYLKDGYQLVRWDGMSTHALTDKHSRVFGLLAGQPNDPTWKETVRGCEEALRQAKESIQFPKRQDRRGTFRTIACGVSYGGGQKRPGNLRQTPHNLALLEELCKNHDFKRMSNFARSIFATYFPDLYDDYANTLGGLYDSDPKLRHVFEGGVWPALSINFPPNAYTKIHTDAGNKANGLCPIFSLGDFDPTQGGHLVLPDLKLVIEFPPGSLIFIPSATLRHGNIPVRPGETRTSWTQYAAGGLFRWMKYGGRSWEALKVADRKRADRELAQRASGWEYAMKLFPTIESLRTRVPKKQ